MGRNVEVLIIFAHGQKGEAMDDLISRQAAIDEIRTMQTYKLFAGDDMLLVDQAEAMTNLMLMRTAEPGMTPYEFCDAMWRIRTDPYGTTEGNHIEADELMCKLLTMLGYGDGVKEFEKMERWYS